MRMSEFVVISEYGRELGGVMVCEIYATYAASGVHAISAYLRDRGSIEGKVMSYMVSWGKYGEWCARLNGMDLIISNGAKIITVEPCATAEQKRMVW